MLSRVNPSRVSKSSIRTTVHRVSSALRHTAGIAELAADGAYPEEGAGYLMQTLDDLEADVKRLRRIVASP